MDDIFTVELVEGLKTKDLRKNKTVTYKRVILREARESDVHNAIRKMERLVKTPEGYKLVFNDQLYHYQRMCEQIERFTGGVGTLEDLPHDVIDIELIGKLHPLDVARIQEHLGLIEISAQVRFGLISQEEADLIMAGKKMQEKTLSPYEVFDAIQVMKNAVAKVTGTSLTDLSNMPLVELEASVKKLFTEKN